MTWKEFKNEVDKQLKEKDISEDDEIWYIDWPGGYDEDEVHVSKDDTSGVAIS